VLAKRDTDDQALIDRWIRAHPHKSGLADAVLAESLVPVYAVIGALPGSDGNLMEVAEVAAAYEVPQEAVAAAIAYYRRHQPLIDERIFTGGSSPLKPA
jgi:uncharacterized protein (DUF433 family)